MTDEVKEAIAEAAREGSRQAIHAHATAIRSAVTVNPQSSVRGVKHMSPATAAGMALAVLLPFGGWVNSVSARTSVNESDIATLKAKQAEIDNMSNSLAALKQELTDFRGDFRDWKRENGFGTPIRAREPSGEQRPQ